MYKYCICIYCYFTRFPDGQRREKQEKKDREARPFLDTVETSGRRREEGHSAWICPRCVGSTPVRLEGDRKEGESKCEGGPGGAARLPRQFVVLLGYLHLSAGWFVCLLACWVVECL